MEDGGTPDTVLLRLAADGDQRALSTLYDRHAGSVTRYAWAILPDRSSVEEVVQDVFVTLWRRAAEITPGRNSLLPWLLVTCRHLAANATRRARGHQAISLELNAAIPAIDPGAEDARELLRWVQTEIERLDPVDRAICERCLIDGRGYAEVAMELGLTVGAVKQRVSRSRQRLRKAVTLDEN